MSVVVQLLFLKYNYYTLIQSENYSLLCVYLVVFHLIIQA